MCVWWNEAKTLQISIDSIMNRLDDNLSSGMRTSAARLLLYVKSLDNALRRARGSRPTGAFVMGAFSRGHLNRYNVHPATQPIPLCISWKIVVGEGRGEQVCG
jgi:hypothetical protein